MYVVVPSRKAKANQRAVLLPRKSLYVAVWNRHYTLGPVSTYERTYAPYHMYMLRCNLCSNRVVLIIGEVVSDFFLSRFEHFQGREWVWIPRYAVLSS